MQRTVARKAASRNLASVAALEPVQKPAFNWNQILSLLPAKDPQMVKLKAMRDEIEQGFADANFAPSTIPAINWESWEQKIKTPGVVAAVRTVLEAQKFEPGEAGRFEWEKYKPQFKDPEKLTQAQEAELEKFDLDTVREQGVLAQDMLEAYEHDHAQLDDFVRGYHLRTPDMDLAEFPELAEMLEELTYHQSYFPTCSFLDGTHSKFATDMDAQFTAEFDWAKCMPAITGGNRDVDRKRLVDKFVAQNKAKYEAEADKYPVESVELEPVLPMRDVEALGEAGEGEEAAEPMTVEDAADLMFVSVSEIVDEDFGGNLEKALKASESLVDGREYKYLATSLLAQKKLQPLLLDNRVLATEEEPVEGEAKTMPASVKAQRQQVFELLALDFKNYETLVTSDWANQYELLQTEKGAAEALAEAKKSPEFAQQVETMKLAVFRSLYDAAEANSEAILAGDDAEAMWSQYYAQLQKKNVRIAKQFGFDYLKGGRTSKKLDDTEYRVDESTFEIGREITTNDLLAQASYTHRRLTVEELIDMSAALKTKEAETKAAAEAKVAASQKTE
ncbi:MAG: hypothetical protein MHM6MM_001512 [Cercozoa sp. M6MM]